METAEAFAHYTRGALTFFFIVWCLRLNKHKERNMMMRLLFTASAWTAFCYLKDIVLLFSCCKNLPCVEDLVILTDLTCVPLIGAFFIETVRPGHVTLRKMWSLFAVQALFIPLYALFPSIWLMVAAYVATIILSFYILLAVFIFTARYNRYIESSYSYTDNIEVKWVRNSCVVLMLFFFGYIIAFHHATWLSEAVYNALCLGLWVYVFSFVRRHKVLGNMEVQEQEDAAAAAEGDRRQENYDYIATRLADCMEQQKLWLWPKVSIYDVASAVGTNKTYLSDYLNRRLGMTFYDYINNFRIQNACAIIDAMPRDGKKTMTEVAQQSGFNSLSSFNRYFVKVKRMSPKEYILKGGHLSNEEKSAQ